MTALIDLTLLSTPSRTRGIGRYAADLAGALHEAAPRLDELHVRAIERFGWTGPATLASDLPAAVRRLIEDPRRFSHAEWAYRVRFRLAAIVRRARPDVMHSPHPDATPIGPLRCPRVVTCHDLITIKAPEHYAGWRDGWRWGRRLLDARRYRSADHVIAVSQATADDLIAILGIDARRITVVHHGVDTTRFSAVPGATDAAVRTRHHLGHTRDVLFVGAADWRKNADGMLGALNIVRQRTGAADVVLAWAGRIDPDQLAALVDHAARTHARDALRLLGYVPDEELAAIMRGAVALLLVSRLEGFGYPAVEAMACGCPVIGSDRPATREMAANAAWLVDPERPEAIAEALLTLLDDASERRRLSERGIERSRTFGLPQMAEQTADVYRRTALRRVHRSRPTSGEPNCRPGPSDPARTPGPLDPGH